MTRQRSFEFKFDARPLEALGSRLEQAAENVGTRLSAAEVANEVVARWQPRFQRAMNAGLNLSDEYVASRMQTVPANAAGPGAVRAEIVTRGALTIIGHYPNEQLRAEGTTTRSGQSRGRRAAGVRVEIKKGAPVVEPQWFLMRLRRGTEAGDKVGLFVRTSSGRVKHLYGPAPYSLFRFQIGQLDDTMADDLAASATSRMADALVKAVTP